jgi:ParB family chromosome partitioning protein
MISARPVTDAVLVGQFPQLLHEGARHLVEAALALHRLDDEGGDAGRIDIGLEQLVEHGEGLLDAGALQLVRERNVEHVRHHGAEARLVGLHLAGQRHAHEGAAVESAGEGDDGRAAGRGARDLDRVLDRLGAGGDEDGFLPEVARHGLVEALGQPHVIFIGHDLMAGVGEVVELVLDGGDHLGVAVAGVDHGDAGSEVDVAPALHVPDLGILGALGVDLRRDADTARDGLGAGRGD